MDFATTVYLADETALRAFHEGLKCRACPSCRRCGCLIFHGSLFGYSGHSSCHRHRRGQRVFCSHRHRRRGCGRTFSVLFSLFLRARVIPAVLVAGFVAAVLAGASRRTAWLGLGHRFSLESGYRLWRQWTASQSHLRHWLCRYGPPPEHAATGHPASELAQTWAHLRGVAGVERCPVAAFQERFQTAFFHFKATG